MCDDAIDIGGDTADEARPAVRDKLAEDLLALSDTSRTVWQDPGERRQLIGDLLGESAGRAATALTTIDTAVQELLALTGLPRGLVAGVHPVRGAPFAGQKKPDCTLQINLDEMQRLSTFDRGSDTTLRTWVHESVHARHPYVDDHLAEYRRWSGYEEGLAEGLARLVVRGRAGLDPIEASYRSYVTSYETLSDAAGVDYEDLLRALWLSPAGTVRQGLADAVVAGRNRRSLPTLSSGQRVMLVRAADLLFEHGRAGRMPDRGAMLLLWRGGLQ